MLVNGVQTNTYSQQSFGAKMAPRLLKGFKKELAASIRRSKDPKEVSYLINLAKRFEQYLKDIKTETNVSTITTKKYEDRNFHQVGLGYSRCLPGDYDYRDEMYTPKSLNNLITNCPAESIKQTEKEFLEKHTTCENLKGEILSTQFFSDNKLTKFFKNIFGKTNK